MLSTWNVLRLVLCVGDGRTVYLLVTSFVVAGEMGKAASGQVTTEAGPAATPSSLLPSEPERPPVAADVVSGE